MLELAADLRLLDEPADQVGVVAVVLAEHLDGQLAAEVGVAALEHGPHAAAGDLAVDPVAVAAPSPPRPARSDQRRLGAAVGVAEQDAGDGRRRSPRASRASPPSREGARGVGPRSGWRKGPDPPCARRRSSSLRRSSSSPRHAASR